MPISGIELAPLGMMPKSGIEVAPGGMTPICCNEMAPAGMMPINGIEVATVGMMPTLCTSTEVHAQEELTPCEFARLSSEDPLSFVDI